PLECPTWSYADDSNRRADARAEGRWQHATIPLSTSRRVPTGRLRIPAHLTGFAVGVSGEREGIRSGRHSTHQGAIDAADDATASPTRCARSVATSRGPMPSLCILERSVVRFRPRRTAAPRG